MKMTWGLAFLAVLALNAPALADIVRLQNGVKMEGILGKDEDGGTNLQVSPDGFVTLDTATVVSIQPQTREENARLKAKWEAEDRDASAAEKFTAAQRARGLMLLDGEWVTADEYDHRLASDKLDLERYTATHRPVRIRAVKSSASDSDTGSAFEGSTSVWSSRVIRRRASRASSGPLPRLGEYSSSGNFIRRSEFARPSAHDGKVYDPSTGLDR